MAESDSNYHDNVIVDGVLRYPPSGIKVLIVGGGIAGLFTAIECWRKGHEVQVLERGSRISTAGDTLGLGPSAWATLQNYPSMLAEYDQEAMDVQQIYYELNGHQTTGKIEFEWNKPGVAQHAAYPLRIKGAWARNDLAKLLFGQVQRLGIPITWKVNIVKYEDDPAAESPRVIAADGKTYSGDVILAADGIGTKSHQLTLGHPVEVEDTGYTCYRVMFPAANLSAAPHLLEALNSIKRPELRVYSGPDCHCISILSKKIISLAVTVPEKDVDRAEVEESWSSSASADDVLAAVAGGVDAWDPLLVEGIRNTPKQSIIRWKLCMRDPQPKWLSDNGRILQVGDSAHSFLPTSANGACTAIEDTLSVAECLRLGGGKEGARIALKVHELLRYQRTTLIQRIGFENRLHLHHKTENLDEGGEQIVFTTGRWHWGHNSEKYATENFEKARAHLETGAPFVNTNLPPGHKWEQWTLAGEIAKEQAGDLLPGDLRQNGDWGVL
ncbi:monooxygenase [Biscogniauxia marginata]|nr:monooxygenase [Biscogniauxia marginata]